MTKLRGFSASIGVLAAVLIASSAQARTMAYQGILYDSTGGTQQAVVAMTVCLTDSPSKSTDGSRLNLWCETHPAVSVSPDGLFTVELGSIEPLDDSLFDRELWLEISVDGETLSPRTHLGGAPFAFVSSRVSGDFHSYLGGMILTDPLDSNRWVDIGYNGIFIPVDTFIYPIPSSGGWVPSASGVGYSINLTGGTMAATGLGASDSAAFYAEVHLPDGVKVIGLQAYMLDNDAVRDFSFTFGYRGGTVSTPLATVWSTGASGAWHTIETTLNYTMQNDCARAYYVKAVARGSAYMWGNVCLVCTRTRIQ